MAFSIWVEGTVLRSQYSPQYLCSLLIQGRGEGGEEKQMLIKFEHEFHLT